MKNKVITTSFIATMLTVGILGGLAYAEPSDIFSCDDRQDRMELKHDKRLEIMAEVLDLSEAQKQQIRDIVEQERTEMGDNKKKMCEGREQMRTLLESDTFDEAAIRSLAQSQSALRTEMLISRAKVKHQVFQLLTADQQELAEKLKPLLYKQGKHHQPMREN